MRGSRTLQFAVLLASICEARFFYGNFRDTSHLFSDSFTPRQGSGDCLELSSPTHRRGWVWYDHPIDLDATSGFFTTFNFRIRSPTAVPSHPRGAASPVGAAAVKRQKTQQTRKGNARVGRGDGFAFVIQAQGPHWSGESHNIGFAGVHGLAVEFDTKLDAEERDPSSSHVSVHSSFHPGQKRRVTGYEADEAAIYVPNEEFRGGHLVTAQLIYHSGIIKVFLNDLSHVALEVPVGELHGRFWVGFTATSSGPSEDTHQICDWYLERDALRTVPIHLGGKRTDHDLKQEACDPGFSGDSCALDLLEAAQRCMRATSGCVSCTQLGGDCGWCASRAACAPAWGVFPQRTGKAPGRTLNSTADGRKTTHAPLCDAELLTLPQECIQLPKTFPEVWSWILLLCVCLLAVSALGAKFAADVSFYLILLVACAGVLASQIVTFGVNEALVEVTLSPLYAVLVGLLLMFLGVFLLFQALTYPGGSAGCHAPSLVLFSLLMLASGVICFLLEKDWSTGLSARSKIPLYSLLGFSLSFAIVFCVLDLCKAVVRLAKLCAPLCRCEFRLLSMFPLSPLAESRTQIRLLAFASLSSGLWFGWVFGALDVEDIDRRVISMALRRDNYYCYPVAAAVSGTAGALGEWLYLRAIPSITLSGDDEIRLLLGGESSDDDDE